LFQISPTHPTATRSSPIVDRSSLGIFLIYMLAEIIAPYHPITHLLALILAGLHGWRSSAASCSRP
jgi:hypothetical protein